MRAPAVDAGPAAGTLGRDLFGVTCEARATVDADEPERRLPDPGLALGGWVDVEAGDLRPSGGYCSQNASSSSQTRRGLRPERPTTPLELVNLSALMARSSGSKDVAVALMDGPVVTSHPDLAGASIRAVAGGHAGTCTQPGSSACAHGTFVAGILAARRESPAPAICPRCTLVVRPIFRESRNGDHMPAATPGELAEAIAECVDAGARVLNLSAATSEPSTRSEHGLQQSLDYAMRRGALVVAAAGNQATIGSSAITRHPWVVPVAAYDSRRRPMGHSNLGGSIGRQGLGAPGEAIESLGVNGSPLTLSGTSVAAPFVTGAIALLWSEFPAASAAEVRRAVTQSRRRTAVAPPMLDAWAAYRQLGGR